MALFGPDFHVFVGSTRLEGALAPTTWRTLLHRDNQLTHACSHPLTPSQIPGGALDVDLAALTSLAAASGRRLNVTLSDAHCRYLCVARPIGVRNREELEHVLREHFTADFGDSDASWSLAFHTPIGSNTDLVVGVRTELLSALRSAASLSGLEIRTIRPFWAACRDRLAGQLSTGAHWLITAVDGWVVMGYLTNGECRFVRSMRPPAQGAQLTLNEAMNRHEVLLPDADPLAQIWLVGKDIDANTPSQSERLHWLSVCRPWIPSQLDIKQGATA